MDAKVARLFVKLKTKYKDNNVFSSRKDLILFVPQGATPGPSLFNIYEND